MSVKTSGFHVEDTDAWRSLPPVFGLGLQVLSRGRWATATLTVPDYVAAGLPAPIIEDCAKSSYTLATLEELVSAVRTASSCELGLSPADADNVRRERVALECKRLYLALADASGTGDSARVAVGIPKFKYATAIYSAANQAVAFPADMASGGIVHAVSDGTLWHYGLAESALLVSALRVSGSVEDNYGRATTDGLVIAALSAYAVRADIPLHAFGD